MALNRLCSWSVSRVPWKTNFLAIGGILATNLFIPNRGKKVQKKKKKTKESKSFRDFSKAREAERLLKIVALKVAKIGDPLDPEMLNPNRERSPPDLNEKEKERRVLVLKKWQRESMKKHIKEQQHLQEIIRTRRKALLELKEVSEPLYIKAMEFNPALFPMDIMGPTETPPIPGYRPPEPDE